MLLKMQIASLSLFLMDGSLEAEVVGFDYLSDLALLEVDTQGVTLPEIQWGDSGSLLIGEMGCRYWKSFRFVNRQRATPRSQRVS